MSPSPRPGAEPPPPPYRPAGASLGRLALEALFAAAVAFGWFYAARFDHAIFLLAGTRYSNDRFFTRLVNGDLGEVPSRTVLALEDPALRGAFPRVLLDHGDPARASDLEAFVREWRYQGSLSPTPAGAAGSGGSREPLRFSSASDRLAHVWSALLVFDRERALALGFDVYVAHERPTWLSERAAPLLQTSYSPEELAPRLLELEPPELAGRFHETLAALGDERAVAATLAYAAALPLDAAREGDAAEARRRADDAVATLRSLLPDARAALREAAQGADERAARLAAQALGR